MQLDDQYRSTEDIPQSQHKQAPAKRRRGARNQDNKGGLLQTPNKKPLRVVIIESSDKESGIETLTTAFTKLAASSKSPALIIQPAGNSSASQGTLLQTHHNNKIYDRNATPSAPRDHRNRPVVAAGLVTSHMPASFSTLAAVPAPIITTASPIVRAPAAAPAPAAVSTSAPSLLQHPPPMMCLLLTVPLPACRLPKELRNDCFRR